MGSERTTESLRPGDVVGHYEIAEELARGGMGVIYRARDRKLNAT